VPLERFNLRAPLTQFGATNVAVQVSPSITVDLPVSIVPIANKGAAIPRTADKA
jgi:ribosomal protein L9